MCKSRKYTYETVKQYFENEGCKLLSTDYKSTKQKLDYICNCGEISSIKFEKFKIGQRCRKCSYKKTADSRRFDYNFVKKFFESNNCKLLSKEYVNNITPLEYICECGNESKITFGHFQKGVRCRKCAGNENFTYEYVRDYFESQDCILLSEEYINSKTKLNYICECGNLSSINFYSFKRGVRCWSCRSEKIANARKLDYEFVKEIFEINGFKLLSTEYKNIGTKLECICPCGEYYSTYLQHVQDGGKCQECRKRYMSENFSGKNSPNYNHDLTEEERLIGRKYSEYRIWRKKSLERDNYTCQCCNQMGGKLNVHHLDGYHWCKERRTDLTNSATLCDSCHTNFHKKYGRKNNTEQQYKEFIKLNKIKKRSTRM